MPFMLRMTVRMRQSLRTLLGDIHTAERICASWPQPISFLSFIIIALAEVFVQFVTFLVSVPLHVAWSPQQGFQQFAERKDNGEFVESYTAYVKRTKYSVAVTIVALLVVVTQLTIFGLSLYRIGKPSEVEAYTTSTTVTATYDITSSIDIEDTYACQSETDTQLSSGFNSISSVWYNSNIQFPLSSVPNNATVTKVELLTYVSRISAANNTLILRSSDGMPSESCADKYNDLVQSYATANWSTLGAKTTDLGSVAVSDVQARIASSDVLSLAIGFVTSGGAYGSIYSMNNATNKPQLKVTYTLPPQAATGFAKGSATTSSIVWNWTDNATAETRYDVHDGASAGSPVTGCTNLPAGTQTCAETGLSANTQYTRHPNATDADGNTDGASASAYTAIETPTGINFATVSDSTISVTAGGTLSNLASGSSGLYFAESATGTNSGWTQANSWLKTGLTPNKQYSYTAQARNGDSDETSTTSAATKYTLPQPSGSISANKSTVTWLSSSPTFTNNGEVFGEGTLDRYRYVWNENASHTFTGSETSWSNNDPVTPATSASGNSYYFHVQAFNGENVEGTGTQTDSGPYYIDLDDPPAAASVNDGVSGDAEYASSATELSANWSTIVDAESGLQKYQYAIGTTSGGTDIVNWADDSTDTSVTQTGLSLVNGSTYYFSVRAVDNAGNIGAAATSDGVVVNTDAPSITDSQTGDATPRKAAGTTYNVDFAKSAAGPQLSYAQYAVYSGANKTGTLIKDWTDIFRSNVDSYATDWSVDFASLAQGVNYVSVKVAAGDGLTNELDDAFTVLKDTVAPNFTSFVSAPTSNSAVLSWTTDEPTTTQLSYGLTTAYGATTTLDPALTTNHSVTLSGLAENTTFHASALGSDEAGNSGVSADLSFATSAGAHTYISNVRVTTVSPTSVTVTWTTNEPATSKVRYGATTDYGLESYDATLVTSHSVTLTGLTAGTIYHYEVISVGSTTDHDADATFTTEEAAPEPTPTPVPEEGTETSISSVRVVAGETITTFFWTTNEPATSKVRYGTTEEHGTVKSSSAKTKNHELQISGLKAGTAYHYELESVGTTTATTEDETFTTNTPLSTVNRAIPPTLLGPSVSDGTDPTLTITGVAKGGQTLRVYVDGKLVDTITLKGKSSSTKSFAATIDLTKLSAGKHTVYVQSTDSAGRTSLVKQRLTFTVGKNHTTRVRVQGQAQYTVQGGDSLWLIASRYLGDGKRYRELVLLNLAAHPSLGTNPSTILPGWVLSIPAH